MASISKPIGENDKVLKSKLCADVAPFYPKSYFVSKGIDSSETTQNDAINNVPSYITNCYPFIQEPTSVQNPHWRNVIYNPRYQNQQNFSLRQKKQNPESHATKSSSSNNNNSYLKKSKPSNSKQFSKPPAAKNTVSNSLTNNGDKSEPDSSTSYNNDNNSTKSEAKKKNKSRYETRISLGATLPAASSRRDNVTKASANNQNLSTGKVNILKPDAVSEVRLSGAKNISILKKVAKEPILAIKDETEYPSLGSSVKLKNIRIDDEWIEVPSTSEAEPKSYSDMLKKVPKPKVAQPVDVERPKKKQGSGKTERKKFPKENKKEPNGKKTMKPKANSIINIDIGDIISQLQNTIISRDKQSKKVQSKSSKVRFLAKKGYVGSSKEIPHNPLDSSAPLRKRGKERLIPKPRKPSSMKKVILMEREIRKKMRLEKEEQKGLIEVNLEHKDKENVSEKVFNSVLQDERDPSKDAKILLHSRQFRDYCDHFINQDINDTTTRLLQDLVRFQDNLHNNDPVKAKYRRRIVLGMNEVTKHVKNGKIRCVIIAPNLERTQSKGGTDDTLHKLMQLANDSNIPLVFALSRRRLGKVCKKVVAVSCVGIFNYSGSDENFKCLIKLSAEERRSYGITLKSLETDLSAEHIPPHLLYELQKKCQSRITYDADVCNTQISL